MSLATPDKVVKVSPFIAFILVSLGFCVACRPVDKKHNQNKVLALSEKKVPTAVELKPHTSRPLTFPAGTFPWQPKDTAIIVHTYLESLASFPFSHQVSRFHRNHLNPSQLGYEINFPEQDIRKIARDRIKEPLWVSFDHPAFRVNNQMVFYEVSPFDYYTKSVRKSYRPLWKMGRHWWVGTNESNLYGWRGLSFFIKKDSQSKAETFTSNKSFPDGEPIVNDKWLTLVKAIVNPQSPQTVMLYQWLPESGRVVTTRLVSSFKTVSYGKSKVFVVFFS